MNYCIIAPNCVRNNDATYNFPIGIAYVSSSLKNSGRNVITYNLNYKEKPIYQILKELILNNSIDVIASGGITSQYNELYEIFKVAKQIKPSIKTWVGGGIITSSPIPAMKALEYADYGMIGEGEITICELAEAMEGLRTLESVDGIIYYNEGKWILTKPRTEIQDLDTIPFPDYEGFEYGEIIKRASKEFNFEDFSGTVVFSRSCPFHCTFCFHPSGTKYRKRSIANILKEIDYLIDQYHLNGLYVADELFALRNEELDIFCSSMKERNLMYFVSLRVDIVTEDMVQKLKDSGCVAICFGLESADNRILKSMNKRITLNQIESALAICDKVGMPIQGNFIFGDVAETVESYQNTLMWWKHHPQYSINLTPIIVYPGSELYSYACKNGIIADEVQYIKDGCPNINLTKMSDFEYRKMFFDIGTAYTKGTDLLNNGSLEYKGNGLVNIHGLCPYCGSEQHLYDKNPFRFYANPVCNHCGRVLNICALDYMDKELWLNNFRKLCSKKVALWGIANCLEALYVYIPELVNEEFLLIDSSPIKQGIKFHGKIVLDPKYIKENDVDVVVITVVSASATTIHSTIIKSYTNVKSIIYLADLLDPHFKEKYNL